MVYIRLFNTPQGTRYALRRMDRTAVECRYFKSIGEARKRAEELGLQVIN